MICTGSKVGTKMFGDGVGLVLEGHMNGAIRLPPAKLRFIVLPIFYRNGGSEVYQWYSAEAEYTISGLLVLTGGFRGTLAIRISDLLPGQWAEVVKVLAP